MLKKEARSLYREKRHHLSDQERMKLDDLLLISFQSAGVPFIHTLLTYAPIEANKEPDTELAVDYLRFHNPELRVCYPVSVLSAGIMQAMLTQADTPFMENAWHIPEPVSNEIVLPGELDMVFVPLLAFDKKGYRVGYGKGFYDRYLHECSPGCLLVGFSYFEPLDRITDADEFDVPLDLCITPQDVYVF